MKAASDAGIIVGWQVENFSRMGKKMKNLEDHLKPEPSAEDKRDAEAAKVAAMLERRARKSGASAPVADDGKAMTPTHLD